MRRTKILPYPLLGKKGYDDSTYFGQVSTLSLSGNEYKVGVMHIINNDEIIAMIESGDLICFTSVANSSFFKQIFICKEVNEIDEIIIPKSKIRGRFELDISFKICAAKDLLLFTNTKFSSLYSNYKFNFDKGQILGEADNITIYLDGGYEQLQQSSSFLRFRRHLTPEEESIVFKTYPDYVTFYLPQIIHEEYKKAKENGSRILLGNLVTPAVMQLIYHIRKNEEEYNDYEKYSWVQTLDERCDDMELFDQDEDELELTRVILDDSIKSSIFNLNRLLKEIDES